MEKFLMCWHLVKALTRFISKAAKQCELLKAMRLEENAAFSPAPRKVIKNNVRIHFFPKKK